jgi:hypothetical protein
MTRNANQARDGGLNGFDRRSVFPTVTEIVEVDKPFVQLAAKVSQPY